MGLFSAVTGSSTSSSSVGSVYKTVAATGSRRPDSSVGMDSESSLGKGMGMGMGERHANSHLGVSRAVSEATIVNDCTYLSLSCLGEQSKRLASRSTSGAGVLRAGGDGLASMTLFQKVSTGIRTSLKKVENLSLSRS